MTSSACNFSSPASDEVPPPGYREAYLALFVVFVLVTLAGYLAFEIAKRRLGRLRKHSSTLLLVSVVGAILAYYNILFREYSGRSTFSCTVLLTIHLTMVPLVFGPLVVKLYVHLHRLHRAKMRAGLSFAAIRREQELAYEREDNANVFSTVAAQFSDFLTLRSMRNLASSSSSRIVSSVSSSSPTKRISRERVRSLNNNNNGGGRFEVRNPSISAEEAERFALDGAVGNKGKRTSQIAQDGFDDDELDFREEGRDAEYSAVRRAPPPGSKRSSRATTESDRNLGGSTRKLPSRSSRTSDYTEALKDPGTPGGGLGRGGDHSQPQLPTPRNHNRKASHRSSTAQSWFNPANGMVPPADYSPDMPLDELVRHEASWFGLFLNVVLCLPYIGYLTARILTDPKYAAASQCTGCTYEAVDILVVCALSMIPLAFFIRAIIVTYHAPDPLGVFSECRVAIISYCTFGLPTLILYLQDPGGVEAQYRFTWLTLETIAILLIVAIQTFAQVYISVRNNQKVPKHINLFRVLENVELRAMFEEHLTREISIENLRFWDRAITFKAHFSMIEDPKKIAYEIFRIFISPEHAVMQLNLSDRNTETLCKFFQPPPLPPQSPTAPLTPAAGDPSQQSPVPLQSSHGGGGGGGHDPKEGSLSRSRATSHGGGGGPSLGLGSTNRPRSTRDLLSLQNLDFLPEIPRDIFDEALKEAFKLMNDGLARFVNSKNYKAFVARTPDFEGDSLRNKEVGLGDLDVSVDEYLKRLGTIEHRPSRQNEASSGGGTTGGGATGLPLPDVRRVSFVPSRFHARKNSKNDEDLARMIVGGGSSISPSHAAAAAIASESGGEINIASTTVVSSSPAHSKKKSVAAVAADQIAAEPSRPLSLRKQSTPF